MFNTDLFTIFLFGSLSSLEVAAGHSGFSLGGWLDVALDPDFHRIHHSMYRYNYAEHFTSERFGTGTVNHLFVCFHSLSETAWGTLLIGCDVVAAARTTLLDHHPDGYPVTCSSPLLCHVYTPCQPSKPDIHSVTEPPSVHSSLTLQ